MKQIKLPIINDEWLDYNDRVFIIKPSKLGNEARFQFDGVSCRQGYTQGFIYKSFKSDLKWFNDKQWYKRTVWSKNPSKIYFHTKGAVKVPTMLASENKWNFFAKSLDKYSISSFDILCEIKAEVETKLRKKISFNFVNIEYGKNWYESYIPIWIDGEEHLLTWDNCD